MWQHVRTRTHVCGYPSLRYIKQPTKETNCLQAAIRACCSLNSLGTSYLNHGNYFGFAWLTVPYVSFPFCLLLTFLSVPFGLVVCSFTVMLPENTACKDAKLSEVLRTKTVPDTRVWPLMLTLVSDIECNLRLFRQFSFTGSIYIKRTLRSPKDAGDGLGTPSDSCTTRQALTWGRYHGGRPPSSDDSFHSPTVIPPSALNKPSIMKRYHRR